MQQSRFSMVTMLVLVACQQEQPAPTVIEVPVPVLSPSVAATAGTSAPAPTAAVGASAAPEPARVGGLFAEQLPKGLPPFDLTSVDLDVMTQSTDLDTEAGKALKRKEYAKAVEQYVEALKVDPGNRGARYNLARALVLNGQHDAGLGVLDQFYQAQGCYPCEALLYKASRDRDFAAIQSRPEFKERTENAGKRLLTIEYAAKVVLAWLEKPQLDNLTPLADSRTFMVLEQKGVGFKQFRGAKAFIEYVVDNEKENFPKGRIWGGKIGPPTGMSYRCPNECCEIDTYEAPRRRSVLRQLCFSAQGNVAVSLYKLKVD